MIFRIGSGGTVEWQSTSRADSGTTDLAFGRDSAGVFGLYTNSTKVTKAALTCGAITASGATFALQTNVNVQSTIHGFEIGSDGNGALLNSTTANFTVRRGGSSQMYFAGSNTQIIGDTSFLCLGGVLGSYNVRMQAATAGALAIYSTDGTTPASLTCGAITASGSVQETPTQSASNPTTSDIPTGKRMGWYNTTLGEFRDWVNIGGTLLKSAVYT
jgi:hypothetical protein